MTALEELKSSLRGYLLRPGDTAYDEARKLWNGMFDRRPAVIVRCAGAADVIGAVKAARRDGLRVADGQNLSGVTPMLTGPDDRSFS